MKIERYFLNFSRGGKAKFCFTAFLSNSIRKKISIPIVLLTNSMTYEPYNDCEKGDRNAIRALC